MFIAGLNSDNPWREPHYLSILHTVECYLLKDELQHIQRARKQAPLFNKTCQLQHPFL